MVSTKDGDKISCAKEPAPNPLDYIIGTGTQTYMLTGYYTEHDVKYYGEDYDPSRDQPRTYTCKSFVVTGGSQDFIDAYNKQIPKINGGTVVNFSFDDLYDSAPGFLKTLLDSNENNQLSLKIKVDPLPERDSLPCEYFGIHFIVSH